MLRSSRFDLNKRCLTGMLRGSGGRSKWPGQCGGRCVVSSTTPTDRRPGWLRPFFTESPLRFCFVDKNFPLWLTLVLLADVVVLNHDWRLGAHMRRDAGPVTSKGLEQVGKVVRF
jgi:hypothetical protein